MSLHLFIRSKIKTNLINNVEINLLYLSSFLLAVLVLHLEDRILISKIKFK